MKWLNKYSDKSDRRNSREMWMEELGRINFNKKSKHPKYDEPLMDDYSEESYP